MYDLIEYSDSYLKRFESLWQYHRDEQVLNATDAIADFSGANNNSFFFKSKQKVIGISGAGGTKDAEIVVPLEYLSNFWRTIEIPLIYCELISF